MLLKNRKLGFEFFGKQFEKENQRIKKYILPHVTILTRDISLG
jgi:hypothetical protein